MDKKGQNETTLKTYTVVLRCRESMLRIPAGSGVRISPLTSPFGDYDLKILTRTDDVKGIDTPIPRELWIEVSGPAPSLPVALNIAVSSANDYVRQVAFGTNAWQGLLVVHLGYDSSPGERNREFFQNWIVDETGLPRVARNVDPDVIIHLLRAITTMPDKDTNRVRLAIGHYTDALQHWKIGNEVYAIAHLYMGVEAITPTVIRWEAANRGLKNRQALERAVCGPPRGSLLYRLGAHLYRRGGGYIPSPVDAWVRREVIFHGDHETYKAAKTASDKLEHGQWQHAKVQKHVASHLESIARYLRNIVLDIVPLDEGDRDKLKQEKLAKPASTGGFERQLLARIISDDDDVAAEDQAYPHVRWEFNLKEFYVDEDGGHRMRVTQEIKPLIAENAQFTPSRIRFSGPSETRHEEVDIETTKAEDATEAGITTTVDDPEMTKWVHPLGSFLLNCNAIRLMSLFWLQKLSSEHRPAAHDKSTFADLTGEIEAVLDNRNVEEELRGRCNEAWTEALRLDEVRELLAGAATKPEGLACFDQRTDGKMALVADLDKLKEANDKAVDLAQRLIKMLDEVYGSVCDRATPPRLN